MSFLDDAYSIKSKLHLTQNPKPTILAFIILSLAVFFIIFQGLWSSALGSTHLVSNDDSQLLETETDDGANETSTADTTKIFIHLAGAVANPGVYELKEGSRLQDAVEAAGGFSSDAATESINLARQVNDGEQVVVLTQQEMTSNQAQEAGQDSSASSPATQNSSQAKININSASASQLTALSGIGEATAAKIVSDRESNGPFKTIEDITRVSGIGEKKFEAIKDFITI